MKLSSALLPAGLPAADDENAKLSAQTCFFVCASALDANQAVQSRQAYCQAEQISEKQFFRQQEALSENWSRKIEKLESRLWRSEWMTRFLAARGRKISSRKFPLPQAAGWMVFMLSMALQQVSLVTRQSFVKKTDMELLLNLLDSPDGFKPCLSSLEKPLIQCAKGALTPGSDRFFLQIMACAQSLAYCFHAYLQGNSQGRIACAIDMMRRFSSMNTAQLRAFVSLHPFLENKEADKETGTETDKDTGKEADCADTTDNPAR